MAASLAEAVDDSPRFGEEDSEGFYYDPSVLEAAEASSPSFFLSYHRMERGEFITEDDQIAMLET